MTEPNRRFTHVVFDLDGTLVDTIPLIITSYRHAYRDVLGVDIADDHAISWIGRPLLDALRDDEPDHADALHESYLAFNTANTERLIRPVPGMAGMLAALRQDGVPVAVATSKRRESTDVALRLMGLAELLPVVVARDDTATHKPDPAPLLLALDRIGGTPGHAAYVGDATFDVEAAHAAGMTAVAVTWGARDRTVLALADHVVDTVDELLDVLRGPAVP